ncbi:MAG: hypothetical protein R2719_12305 [Micropruina sp.]
MRHPARFVPLLVCGLVWLAAAAPAPASPSPSEPAAHGHGSGPEHVTPLVGDGTRHTEFGYSLERLRLPERAGVPGTVSFQIGFWRPAGDRLHRGADQGPASVRGAVRSRHRSVPHQPRPGRRLDPDDYRQVAGTG